MAQKPDPLAALLALKGSGVPGANGTIMSPGVAEENPALGFNPGPNPTRDDSALWATLNQPFEDEQNAAKAQAAKLAQEQAQYQIPEDIKGRYGLATEQERAATQRAMPGIQEQANEQELQAMGGGAQGAGGMRPSITAGGKLALGAAPELSQQTRAMMEGAQMMEPHIAQVADEASTLDQAGLFGPMMSRVRSALAQAGTIDEFTNLVSSDPELNRDPQVGRFATSLGLLASGLGRVHGGARGGSSPQMYNNFKALLSDAGTLPMFIGRLQGADDYMAGYAQGPKPTQGPSVSDRLKALVGIQ